LSSKTLRLEEALRHLADDLDDTSLNALFPAHNAGELRRLLRGEVRELVPVGQASGKGMEQGTIPGSSRRLRLYTDGASRGNPGLAGAGIVLQNDLGEELLANGHYLGRMTNNAAEYRALILGLDAALAMGCEHLAIFLDSELIVRQIQGRYKVKNETLLPLFAEVQDRLGRLGGWTIQHVPRAKNARADEMANQGIDQRS
jgi:ribonuclease HI